jgi:DNA-binding MarR family transcriptional regulator
MNNTEFSTTERMIAFVQEFRKLDPELQAQAIILFLKVAQNDGQITMVELQHWSGLATSSVSRNMALLGKINRHGESGLDLVGTFADPLDRRRKVVHLTPKGRAVRVSLGRYFGES